MFARLQHRLFDNPPEALAQEKQSMFKRTFSIDYNHHQSKKGKTINVQSKVYKQNKIQIEKHKKQYKNSTERSKNI